MANSMARSFLQVAATDEVAFPLRVVQIEGLAVFDLAVFRQWYQESLNLKRNKTGAENSWFVVGISYSGALSAWFRLKFPHLTCGSLACSGVVLAVYNYTDFDKQVVSQLVLNAKPCYKKSLNLLIEVLNQTKKN